LLETVFFKHLGMPAEFRDDAAIVQIGSERIAITTDSYVVQPIEFPGANIGELAIYGTINDIAMRGAMPTHITAAFILEEGLPLEQLDIIVESMAKACSDGDVMFTAGDTKVVNKGSGDKIFITTTGIGRVLTQDPPGCTKAKPGDVILVNGDLGMHGTAVMCARESLKLDLELHSDCAPLHTLVGAILEAGSDVHCFRDITRGGLATVLNELATSSNVGMDIREADVPVNAQVRSVCELLGLDPFYVACEGRMICIAPPETVEIIMKTMQAHELGRNAAIIGTVTDQHRGKVLCETQIGGRRILDKLSGEQLPRIC
jgi:hydrogenase expression/formation protein HypE